MTFKKRDKREDKHDVDHKQGKQNGKNCKIKEMEDRILEEIRKKKT